MELSERKKRILSAVVEEYIASAEPVGSKRVLELSGLDFSPATVRAELAALERAGYLEQPHTSAGRIPTSAGYRLYVNELMTRKKLDGDEADRINRGLGTSREPGKLMGDAGRLATELTSYPSLTITAPKALTVKRFDLIYLDPNSFIIVLLLSDNEVKNKLVKLPFSFDEAIVKRLSAVFNASFAGIAEEKMTPLLIESAERGAGDSMGLAGVIASFAIEALKTAKETETVFSGGESLLKIPEFQDSDKAHKLMSYFSGDGAQRIPALGGNGDVRVLIGPENIAEELRDTSVVLASYDAGDNTRGLIGVVGPTRMDYSKVAAKLSYIADGLSKLLSGGMLPPAGFGKLMISEGDDKRERQG